MLKQSFFNNEEILKFVNTLIYTLVECPSSKLAILTTLTQKTKKILVYKLRPLFIVYILQVLYKFEAIVQKNAPNEQRNAAYLSWGHSRWIHHTSSFLCQNFIIKGFRFTL